MKARRLPLMALAALGLLAGLWAGLQRIGWALPTFDAALPLVHGPLMVGGFLGTLIALERAVALRRRWAYAAPALTGLGGSMLVLGVGGAAGPALVTAGSLVLVLVFGALLRIQRERFVWVMAAGALAWFVGNARWLLGGSPFEAVAWWLGFLVLTIAGERLELSRMVPHPPRAARLFLAAALAFGAGLAATPFARDAGLRVAGVALVALALWLVRYDVARHTVRRTGLTRYIAVCLLAGYAWLAAGGALLAAGGDVAGGPVYDAQLHALFVGFVFSMIFGHAPIILPSVLGVPVLYRPALYAPLAVLHLSLVLRVAGDLGGSHPVRMCGGLLNAAAVVLFIGAVVYARLRAPARRPAAPA